MDINLVTGHPPEKVLTGGSGSINTVHLVRDVRMCIPHIISPIYGRYREIREYSSSISCINNY